ncbi:MAG: purine-nucleoside phosphorylase [Candidatus Ancaeobacter aquaticus]|nr:purine-nucleoside phosphorylase [Candidatus Ancaeobacter aquaticus]
MKKTSIHTSKIISSIKKKTSIKPKIGIISGFDVLPSPIPLSNKTIIPFSTIPQLPKPSVPGHSGRFVLGNTEGKDVIIQEGRFHVYEGTPLDTVRLPLTIMKKLGVQSVIIINAAGGIHPKLTPGDIMLVTDHINFMGTHPLIGLRDNDNAIPFLELTHAYSTILRKIAQQSARTLSLQLKKGVYLGVSGPTYETQAEIRAFRSLGADCVGMSLPFETIFARFLNLHVCGLSIITNIHHSHTKKKVHASHTDVSRVYKNTQKKLYPLIQSIIRNIQ